jgi:rhodanese-related sulfurtransferase
VTGQEAKAAVTAGAQLLDVRNPDEFASGHLPEALNIPVADLGQRLAEVGSKERPVVVYCRSGGRSARAAQELVGAGWTTVLDLGGIGNW